METRNPARAAVWCWRVQIIHRRQVYLHKPLVALSIRDFSWSCYIACHSFAFSFWKIWSGRQRVGGLPIRKDGESESSIWIQPVRVYLPICSRQCAKMPLTRPASIRAVMISGLKPLFMRRLVWSLCTYEDKDCMEDSGDTYMAEKTKHP